MVINMIQKTAIIGMGALGLLYADIIVQAGGNEGVAFIMDEERLKKYGRTEYTINGEKKEFPLSLAKDFGQADLVIVAVKYNGLPSAIESIRPLVGENTIIMSVMNGIDSEEKLAAEYGKQHLIYTVAQGMDAMRFGNALTYTQRGELRIGITDESQKANLEAVKEYFDNIRMPYQVEDDICKRMWSKFMLNVGMNQTCHAFETNNRGVLSKESEEYGVFIEAMQEVITLANAYGIGLTQEDLQYYLEVVKTLSPDAMPSMRQDGIAKRPSEVEMFAGTVRRMAREKGLPTPANDLLYNKIKALEAAY